MAQPHAPTPVSKSSTQHRTPVKQKVKSVARVYADVCDQRDPSYSNYDNFALPWGYKLLKFLTFCLTCHRNQENYEIVRRLGRGKYSEVFEGVVVSNKSEVCHKSS